MLGLGTWSDRDRVSETSMLMSRCGYHRLNMHGLSSLEVWHLEGYSAVGPDRVFKHTRLISDRKTELTQKLIT